MSDPLPTYAALVANAAKLLRSAVLASPPVMNPEQAMRLAELHLLLAAEVRQTEAASTPTAPALPADAPVAGPWETTAHNNRLRRLRHSPDVVVVYMTSTGWVVLMPTGGLAAKGPQTGAEGEALADLVAARFYRLED